MLYRLICTILFSLFSTGLGHATQAELFSFEYLHLLIPQICQTNLPKINTHSTPSKNRYTMDKIQDGDTLNALTLNGSALVYPHDYKNLNLIHELLASEDTSRKNNVGCVWQHGEYYKSADEIDQTGRFMIVHGHVLDVYESYENIYLNFGEDWKTDFTIRVQKSNKTFKGVNLNSFKHKNIQARGFVEYYNGPSLTLNHPILLKEIEE